MILCDHCAHESVCFHETTLRKFARELELPKGPFSVDIFCSQRIPPCIAARAPLPRGASDEFIISKVWPEK